MKTLICKVFGHKYYEYAKPKETWGNGIRWLKCSRCGRGFLMNCRVKALLPMDFEMIDMHTWERVGAGVAGEGGKGT